MESDSKMTNLKFAMSFIRDEMKSEDRLGVVTFDSGAGVLHQLLRMTDANKARVGTALSSVSPSGGTSILRGMQAAQTMLESRQSRNPITAVFLLTDGQDGSDADEKKRVAKAMKDAGVSLFVFGFGADHDSAQLNMIANAAEGSFSFIEQVCLKVCV
jgi:Mg-chelatase subunit ChlD